MRKIINKTCFKCRNIRHLSTVKIIPGKELSATAYQPSKVEQNKYELWEKNGLFSASCDDATKETFSMVLPPPNITGKLHLGHALACTIQDVVARRQRTLGYNVLWLPGTDHAGIATQGVVEKYLHKNGINRQSIGREKFNQHIWEWKSLYGNTICEQLRLIGTSLDWDRLVFTMDSDRTRAVERAFIELYDRGLIYRKKSLVNWCVQLGSTISDIEVETVEVPEPTLIAVPGYSEPIKFGEMFNIEYRVCDSSESIVVSTTRPETMLGDVAIAVHPDDNRYQRFHSKYVQHPFRDEPIPIICDTFVDVKLGTGAVKITPAHDKTDYQVGIKHNLPLKQVINEAGHILNEHKKYSGLKRFQCRKAIIDDLNDLGLIKSIEQHKMNLPICCRTSDIVELIPKEQWFVSCSKMAKKARISVESGDLVLTPERFEKSWIDWCSDERDWCISRQLWWGHQIPAYKCSGSGKNVWVAAETPEDAKNKASVKLKCRFEDVIAVRDSDVLDTWFSSGIYPFSALGWPDKTKELAKFYPLSLMVTGHDILGFWVYRMVILAQELTGKLPFNRVLLHGVICDSAGAKMSKSRGNVIDPVDVINGLSKIDLKQKTGDMFTSGVLNDAEYKKALSYHKSHFPNGIPECGVDALRFTLLTNDVKSQFVHFDLDLCHTNRLFFNKIWQSVKYAQLSFAKLQEIDRQVTTDDLTIFDRWILSRLSELVETVTNGLANYDFHLATRILKKFLYYDFCDFYLESTKLGFMGDQIKGYGHAYTLSVVLDVSLRCLYPFLIYLPEELIDKVPRFENNIIYNGTNLKVDSFSKWRNEVLEDEMKLFINLISVIRKLKGFYSITNKYKTIINILSSDVNLKNTVEDNFNVVKFLTRVDSIVFVDNLSDNGIRGYLNENTSLCIEIENCDDFDSIVGEARERIWKRLTKIDNNLRNFEEKLSCSGYNKNVSDHIKIADKQKFNLMVEEFENLKRMVSK